MVRPTKEAGQVRIIPVNVRLTAKEKADLELLAAARGLQTTNLFVTLVKEDLQRRKELIEAYKKMAALRKQPLE